MDLKAPRPPASTWAVLAGQADPDQRYRRGQMNRRPGQGPVPVDTSHPCWGSSEAQRAFQGAL
jgi:hypothetical protein